MNSWWCEGPKCLISLCPPPFGCLFISLHHSTWPAISLLVDTFLFSVCFESECCTCDFMSLWLSLYCEWDDSFIKSHNQDITTANCQSWQYWVKIYFPGFGLLWYYRPQCVCAWVTHGQTHTHNRHCRTPEPLTEPVFTSDLSKSLTIGLPSSEEVDRAILPALDHLHSQDSKARGQGSDEIHHTQSVSSSSVMSHSTSHCWSLSSSRTKLNELVNACSFTNE